MKNIFLRIAPALLLLTVLWWPTTARAQDLDLTVSPVSFNLSPKPGDVVSQKVTIHNNSSSPIDLELSVNKLGIDEQGEVVPEDLTSQDLTDSWIKFDSDTITAPSREWLEVPFTITVPTDAAYGNYFAIVFSPPLAAPEGGTAAVQGRVLVPILLNVQREGALRQAEITEFKVDNFVSQFLPVNFSATVKNTGNMHVAPRGNIFIRGTGQKDLAILEVNPGQSNILPEASRTFTASWSEGFLVKDDQGHLNINWNKLTDFRMGKYSAYMLLVYDDGQRDIPIEATLTFWVFPYVAVGVILAVVIVTVILTVYVFKALVKKEARKISN